MGVKCRFRLVPDGEILEYASPAPATFEEALLSFGIIPDTVLILSGRTSLPQDKIIEEDEVDIVSTCSRG